MQNLARVEHDEVIAGTDEDPLEERCWENAVFPGLRVEVAIAGGCGEGDLHFLLRPYLAPGASDRVFVVAGAPNVSKR